MGPIVGDSRRIIIVITCGISNFDKNTLLNVESLEFSIEYIPLLRDDNGTSSFSYVRPYAMRSNA
jgi:hypothetical protein